MRIRRSGPEDTAALVALWRSAGLLRPVNDPVRDIVRKLGHDPDGLLVAEQAGRIVGSVMVGYDGHRGWINYLAVDPDHRRSGIGRALVAAAEEHVAALGGAKVNLQVRASNAAAIAFYRRIGYAVDDVVSFGRRMVQDQDQDQDRS